jgi:hypothetical protein
MNMSEQKQPEETTETTKENRTDSTANSKSSQIQLKEVHKTPEACR